MKVAVLFSGGKDSALALHKAMEKEEVVCLISIISENEESYMFHVPNIWITKLQAESIGLPLIQKITKGKKEIELRDLKSAIKQAVDEYNIEGVVTGAVESVYQAIRVQKICNSMKLWCFNPLWKKDQVELLNETLELGFSTIISGIFAYPLNKTWLGKKIDKDMITNLVELRDKYKISPSGEGGEIETTVLNAPFFKKKIKILKHEIIAENNSGVFKIKEAKLARK